MKTTSKLSLNVLATTATLALAMIFGAIPATASAAQPVKPYPLKECLVSTNELGSMGKVITKVHEGQEVKFCCKPCVKKFDKAPTKYLGKLK